MKRIWFAIVFLLISIVLCTGEQYYTKKVHNSIGTKVEQAIDSLNNNDKAGLEASIKNIKACWKNYNSILFSVSDHGVLDDLGAEIRAIDIEDEDIASELSQIKALNEVFYENQRISLANVF